MVPGPLKLLKVPIVSAFLFGLGTELSSKSMTSLLFLLIIPRYWGHSPFSALMIWMFILTFLPRTAFIGSSKNI